MPNSIDIEKWDGRFLDLAVFVADWSKDPSTKVGAVLVRPDRTIAALGFNGFPRGVLDHPKRYDDRPTKYEMVIHAELNALLSSRESLENYTLYVTPLPPCSQCAAAIIQRGIRKVVIAMKAPLPKTWEEKWALSSTMFSEAGIAVRILPERERLEKATDIVQGAPTKDKPKKLTERNLDTKRPIKLPVQLMSGSTKRSGRQSQNGRRSSRQP